MFRFQLLAEVDQDIGQHVFMNEQKGVGPRIERVCHLCLLAGGVDDVVHYRYDLPGEIVQVEDGRVGVEAYGVELVAVLS